MSLWRRAECQDGCSQVVCDMLPSCLSESSGQALGDIPREEGLISNLLVWYIWCYVGF